jgi:hypothetical protein
MRKIVMEKVKKRYGDERRRVGEKRYKETNRK